MNSLRRTFSNCIAFFLLWCALACGEKCQNPCDRVSPQQHYRLYLGEGGYPIKVLVIDIPADTIIDSAVFNLSSNELALNPDKSKILLSNFGDMATTLVVDAYTLTIDTTVPWYGFIHFDNMRNIGLILGSNYVVKFDGSNFTQKGLLNLDLGRGELDSANGRLYANVYGSGRDHIVYVIDYVNMTLLDSIFVTMQDSTPVSIRSLLPISEANRLYVIGSGPAAYIIDTDSDKVISTIPLNSANGNFAMSADHKTVYMCDPGDDFFGIPGSNIIWVFDVERDLVKDYMSVTGPNSGKSVPVVQMRITPDGKYLYASGGFVNVYPLLRFDLDKGTIGDDFYPYQSVTQPFNVFSFQVGGIQQ